MLQPKLVPLALIDPPELAMRTATSDEGLQALAQNIAQNGLLQAVGLIQNAGRYRIVFGHRRYLAFQLLGRDEIPAIDYTGSKVSPESAKFSENFFREEVNDADMALYLAQLEHDHNYTLEQFEQVTGQSEHWISSRLSLVRGDQEVFEALRQGKINLGSAIELNKYPDQFRAQYLGIAIESTPPVRQLEEWRKALKTWSMAPPAEQTAGEQTTAAPALPGVVVDACVLCQGNHAPWDMEYVRVHKTCMLQVSKALAKTE